MRQVRQKFLNKAVSYQNLFGWLNHSGTLCNQLKKSILMCRYFNWTSGTTDDTQTVTQFTSDWKSIKKHVQTCIIFRHLQNLMLWMFFQTLVFREVFLSLNITHEWLQKVNQNLFSHFDCRCSSILTTYWKDIQVVEELDVSVIFSSLHFVFRMALHELLE